MVSVVWAPWANVAVTVILAGITFWYANITHGLLKQAKNAQDAGVQPHIALRVRIESFDLVVVHVHNAGKGPAINLDVTIEYKDSKGLMVRSARWRTPLLATDENERFILRKDDKDEYYSPSDFVEEFDSIRISGSCIDIYGNKISIENSFTYMGEWFELGKNAWQAIVSSPYAKVERELSRIHGELRQIKGKLK